MQFGTTAFERARGNLPQLPVVNMFAERAPTEETGVVLQSRPGLEEYGWEYDAPSVVALFQEDGVLGGERFAVANGRLWRGPTDLGAIDGPGPFSIDGYEDLLFVAGGASLWAYDGTTLFTVPFPDTAPVTKIVVGASRLIAIRSATEQIYWSEPLTATIDALSFSSAESRPDRLRDMLFIDDMLVLFGAQTVEFHPNTQEADLPFRPLEGRVYSRGIRNTGAAAIFGESFAWVTNDHRVCLGDLDTVLSNEGLEEKVKASISCRLWTFYIDSIEMLALRLDDETYVLSSRSRMWSRFESDGGQWLPQCYADGVFGSVADGKLLKFGSAHLDLGGELERRFRGGFPLNAGGVVIHNIVLRTNPGETPYLDGGFADPRAEMRLSRDRGRTWSEWRSVALGAQGQYRHRVIWRACGMASQPGLLADFRVTDPVPFACSDVRVNEPVVGGR